MATTDTTTSDRATQVSRNPAVVIAAWAAVGIPLLWGVALTLKKALALFH
jgi:hypothetical protein